MSGKCFKSKTELLYDVGGKLPSCRQGYRFGTLDILKTRNELAFEQLNA